MTAKYKITSKVSVYSGISAWRFAHVDRVQSEKIRRKHALKKRGFGSIPVSVKLGKTVWKTSIFPEKLSGTYLLPLKVAVRLAEDIGDDDTVTFTLEI